MPPPRTGTEVLDLVRKSGFVAGHTLNGFLRTHGLLPHDPDEALALCVGGKILTDEQAGFIRRGGPAGFRRGKYVLIERLEFAVGEGYHAVHSFVKRRCTLLMLPRAGVEETFQPQEHGFYAYPPSPFALDHPNVVRMFDIDCDEWGHFLVLEHLDGKQLRVVLEQAGGRLPVGEACGCAIQAAVGLDHLLQNGVLHQRISPTTLFACESGAVQLLFAGFDRWDFWEHVPSEEEYFAPEQFLDSALLNRCDCFALGAVLYRMICGRPPFATEAELAMKISGRFASVLSSQMRRDGVPPALAPVLARMMAVRPEERYPSMTEVIAALRPFVEPASTGDYPEMAAAALEQLAASG